MKVKNAIDDLLEIAHGNEIKQVLARKTFLISLKRKLGTRAVQDVTTKDLHDAFLPYRKKFSRVAPREWEWAYNQRLKKGGIKVLPWETETPTPAIAKSFSKFNFNGLNALDLGCGTGLYSLAMAARGASVTGIDISTAALRTAKRDSKRGPDRPPLSRKIYSI